MSASVLFPLALFLVMVAVVAYLLWRLMRVGGELRRGAQQSRAAADLARRTDISIGELCAIVDDLRRHKAEPESGAASLHASAAALSRYSLEAEAIARKGPGLAPAVSLAAEIQRARRAVDLIEHGRLQMALRTIEHANEGETEVKRGYLNLVHAREAIRGCGEEITRAATSDARGWPRRR